MNKKSVLVAISGGVDSSTTAYLLQKQGFEVLGIYFILTDGKTAAANMIKKVSKNLDIEIKIIDLRNEFKKTVVKYFINEYMAGRTPNPCVFCNLKIKFDQLVKLADKFKCDYISTGHYAKIEDFNKLQITKSKCQMKNQNPNVKIIKIAKDENKDQTYFLWKIKPKWLNRIIFPLGKYTKSQVRKIAKKAKLPTFDQKESQEACFISDKNINEYLSKNLPKQKSGVIKNFQGKVLGKHQGLAFYTIGQREGINIASYSSSMPRFYVVKKDFQKNELILGQEKELYQNELKAKGLNLFISEKEFLELSKSNRLFARIRYLSSLKRCEIRKMKRNQTEIKFFQKQRAITPGQSIVFYRDKKELLGGGIIE